MKARRNAERMQKGLAKKLNKNSVLVFLWFACLIGLQKEKDRVHHELRKLLNLAGTTDKNTWKQVNE